MRIGRIHIACVVPSVTVFFPPSPLPFRLGSWLQETDQKFIEDQLQPNSASGSGALEHDPTCLYLKCPEGEDVPGPLPLGKSSLSFVHISLNFYLGLLS